jgi:hypothetical protein
LPRHFDEQITRVTVQRLRLKTGRLQTITKASAASLGLEEGKIASAVIKASSVMVAVD